MDRARDPKTGMFLPGPHSFVDVLQDVSASRWIRSYQNVKSREDYARAFKIILYRIGLTPKQLLDLDVKDARERVMDIVRDYLDDGRYAAARQIQTVAKGFFEFHDKQLIFKRAERIRKIRKKIAYEVIPAKEQVYAMADYIKKPDSLDRLRTRAIILCLFQSGVRVGCLCRWTVGTVRSQLYPSIKVPVYVKVTNEMDTKLSGYGLPYYYTFLQREAAEALHEYLDWRMKMEGKLDDQDFVFKPARKFAKNKRTEPDRVLELVKAAARAVGLDPKTVWTHVLRKSFRKVLNATPELDEDTKEALMGHTLPGSRGSYFDVHDIDEIAAKYMMANFSSGLDIKAELEQRDQTIKELHQRLAQYEVQMRRISRLSDEDIEALRKLITHRKDD
jgi:integrase